MCRSSPLGGFTPLQSDALSDVARRLDATPMQVALAWLLQRSPNILLIPGTSSLGHLRENLAAAGLDLPADEISTLGPHRGGARAGRLTGIKLDHGEGVEHLIRELVGPERRGFTCLQGAVAPTASEPAGRPSPSSSGLSRGCPVHASLRSKVSRWVSSRAWAAFGGAVQVSSVHEAGAHRAGEDERAGR